MHSLDGFLYRCSSWLSTRQVLKTFIDFIVAHGVFHRVGSPSVVGFYDRLRLKGRNPCLLLRSVDIVVWLDRVRTAYLLRVCEESGAVRAVDNIV